MKVVLVARDKPDSLELRKANRPDHVAYLQASGVVEQAGPILNAEGEMVGSVIVLVVEDMAAAQAFAKDDPYAKAGLFERVELMEWNRVIGG